ncbi:formyltransferase family protein [Nonomuraea sp. NPDC004702]
MTAYPGTNAGLGAGAGPGAGPGAGTAADAAGSRPPVVEAAEVVDADFTPARILAELPRTGHPAAPEPVAGLAEAALADQWWQIGPNAPTMPHDTMPDTLPSAPPGSAAATAGASNTPTAAAPVRDRDAELLHRFETSPLWRPPIESRSRALTPAGAKAWLLLARHWLGVSAASGDLRFLNAACKLLGTVWTRHRADQWSTPDLLPDIRAVAALVDDACAELANRLSHRVLPPTPAPAPSEPPLSEPAGELLGTSASGRLTTVILAGAGSSSPPALFTHLRDLGVEASAVCWYGSPPEQAAPSAYDSAWYPPTPPHPPGPAPDVPAPQAHVTSWPDAAAALTRWQPDLLILLGMPIVPAEILAIPTIGTLNAHNGALPTYRGMDAVAWALLNNDPIICTIHQVNAGVDTGPVLLTRPVPLAPPPTLRQRVKDTQLTLLAAVTAHIVTKGRLPDGHPQPPHLARQFYRLHPHLKRIMNASPYGTGDQR